MDARYYQQKRKREKEGNMTARQIAEREEENNFFLCVLGFMLAGILLLGALGMYGHYDTKQRKADADSCENLGGRYIVVEKTGKTQIWGCVK